jgi:hypothetical protein
VTGYDDEPVGLSFAAIRNGLIASMFCWAFIGGMGYVGYRISQYI